MVVVTDTSRDEKQVIAAAIAEGAGVRRELVELHAKDKPQFKDSAVTDGGGNDSLIGQDIDYDEDGDMGRHEEHSGNADVDDDNVISFQSDTATQNRGSSIFSDWQLERIVDAHNRQNPNPITTEQVQNIMQMVQRQDFGESVQRNPQPQLPHGQKRAAYLEANSSASRPTSHHRGNLHGESFKKISPFSASFLATSSAWTASAQRTFAQFWRRIQKEPTASAASIVLGSLLLFAFLPAITVGLFAAAATALLTASWALSATFVTASIAVAMALCAATFVLICAAVLLAGRVLFRVFRRLSNRIQALDVIKQNLSAK